MASLVVVENPVEHDRSRAVRNYTQLALISITVKFIVAQLLNIHSSLCNYGSTTKRLMIKLNPQLVNRHTLMFEITHYIQKMRK